MELLTWVVPFGTAPLATKIYQELKTNRMKTIILIALIILVNSKITAQNTPVTYPVVQLKIRDSSLETFIPPTIAIIREYEQDCYNDSNVMGYNIYIINDSTWISKQIYHHTMPTFSGFLEWANKKYPTKK